MNGSEEAGGATKGSTTFKNTNKQPMPPVRSKTVRYGRHTNFGAAGDNDEYIGTTHYTNNSNMPTPDEDDSVQQPQRPLPPSEPPPPLPRRPKPGTGKVSIIRQQRATQESSTWDNASHRRQQTQRGGIQRAARKSLLEEQGEIYGEIYRSVNAGTNTWTVMLIDKLYPIQSHGRCLCRALRISGNEGNNRRTTHQARGLLLNRPQHRNGCGPRAHKRSRSSSSTN